MTQASIFGGRRSSTFNCYLKPASKRANLIVRTKATAQSLIFRDGRCAGVRYLTERGIEEVFVSREVIVSAGVIGSPLLLELSGIGAAKRLQDLGIEVKCNLPGVGENLRDHRAPRMQWSVAKRGVTYNERARGLRGPR